MHKVAIISGSRADYSLLYPVIKEFLRDKSLDVSLIVTGCETVNSESLDDIFHQDGLNILAKIRSGSNDGSNASVCNAIALTIQGFSKLFSSYCPDIIVVLGDRFEIFAAVQAAWIFRIPIAHIAGGDVTEGAIDEAFRHSISKMSRLHFVTNKDAKSRVLQLGESKENVHLVGSPGIDNLLHSERLSRDDLGKALSLHLSEKIYLLTLHPETLSYISPKEQVECVIEALKTLPKRATVIITAANADPGGEQINSAFKRFADSRENVIFVSNLGRTAYVSLMALATAMIGNSSSGIYEAASFNLPVVNIGNRQAGRPNSTNIINCDFDTQAIIESIRKCDLLDCQDCENPFGDGNSAQRIHKITIDYLNSRVSKEQGKTFQRYLLGDV